MARRRRIGLGLALAVPILVVIAVRFFVDEPLRRAIKRNVNSRLVGYTVRIGTLRFHPLDFSIDLLESAIVQNADPDPPIAHIPLLRAGVHWRAILYGRLVADFLIDRPTLRIDLTQARREIADPTPMSKRGWQDALEEVYPLKVNVVTIRDADITYVDQGPYKPLRLSQVNFRATNIRNVHSRERVNPSEIHLDGVVFDTGFVRVNGHADFLVKPYPGLKGEFALRHVELNDFKPIIRRCHVSVRNGVLSTDGNFEYAPSIKVADLEHVAIEGVQIDYVHRAETAAAEQQVAKEVARSAKELSDHPEILLRIDEVSIRKSSFGFVNHAADPAYRLFLADADIRLGNVSNHGTEGKPVGSLRGKFMGSGDTLVNVAFRPKAKSPEVDLQVRVREAKMPALNDVLLAYGDFDVVDGLFSFHADLRIRNEEVT